MAYYAPYMKHLPADVMALITMHKIMVLLITKSLELGCVTELQAAREISETIDLELCLS